MSSLTHTIKCPNCGRPVAASLAHVGQRVACPSCRGEFLLSPAALLAPAGAGTKSAAESANGGSAAVAAPPAPPSAPPRQLTPPQPQPSQFKSNTAQFLASQPQATTIAPQADGKLPTLQLADAPEVASKASGEASPVPLWAALLAVAGSTAISLILLFGDLEGKQTSESKKAQARADVAALYATGSALPKPYQVELRQAQLAHSRGDRKAEREHYRKVLAMLRVEGRSKFQGLTGTPIGDAELDRLLSILLADP